MARLCTIEKRVVRVVRVFDNGPYRKRIFPLKYQRHGTTEFRGITDGMMQGSKRYLPLHTDGE